MAAHFPEATLRVSKNKLDRNIIQQLDPSALTPHGDRYIIKKWDVGKFVTVQTSEGIKKLEMAEIVSWEEKHGYYLAVVISKGSGHRMETDVVVPMPFEPGETVIVEKFSGRELIFGSETYMIINQVDILAKINLRGFIEKASA